MSTAAHCKTCFKSPKRCRCKIKRSRLINNTEVVNALNQLNTQLSGINSNVNNDINNLTNVINNTNSNLNSNVTSSLSTLSASITDTIAANTNTIISNMNTAGQEVCINTNFSSFTNYSVPCGTSRTFYENFSTSSSTIVDLQVFINSLVDNPCRAVLVILTMDGTIIERALPVMGEFNIQIENYSSISIRCESVVGPPPADSVCTGFMQLQDFFCVCCNSSA